jgi:hypothetical protein
MILHRTHFKRARPWASGAGRNNAKYEQQSFYQLNNVYQHTQELPVISFVRLA